MIVPLLCDTEAMRQGGELQLLCGDEIDRQVREHRGTSGSLTPPHCPEARHVGFAADGISEFAIGSMQVMRDRPFFGAEKCENEVVDDRAQVPKGAVSQVREFFAQHDTVPAHKSDDPRRPPTPPTIDVAMAAPTTDVLSQQPTTPR